MTILLFVIGLAAAAGAVWWVTQSLTRKKHAGLIHTLESKIRAAEGEAFHLKEQVGTLRGEVIALQKTLSEERVSKQEALVALSAAFQKGLIGIAAAAFITSAAVAGPLAWMASSWRTKADVSVQSIQEKVDAELTKLKLELLEKHYVQTEADRKAYQNAWQEERILRTAAETRLEILLGGFAVPGGFQGVSLPETVSKDGEAADKAFPLLRQTPLRAS